MSHRLVGVTWGEGVREKEVREMRDEGLNSGTGQNSCRGLCYRQPEPGTPPKVDP